MYKHDLLLSLARICRACQQRPLQQPSRLFSWTAARTADSQSERSPAHSRPHVEQLLSVLERDTKSQSELDQEKVKQDKQRYYFHVYSHKHNTHITVCRYDHSPLPGLSLSAGNMGFRKASRGTYDAAYQLAAFIFGRMTERGLLDKRTGIREMEVILRGFGMGREAVTKAFLGTEGVAFRDRISRVTDSTRLKFGGTRGEKPRRLG